MHASVLVLGAMLGSHALASHGLLPLPVYHNLKRQVGNAFDPAETEECSPDWPICGTSPYCYNTAEDYTCCPGEEHVCPPGSYCLSNPYCCPDEYDPESCADMYGITLEPTPTPTSTTSTSSTPVIPTTTTTPSSSSSAVPPTETPESPEFTGAANVRLAGSAAAVVGWLGFFGNLLI
ncbi:hypothetical protein BJX63DRAFT_376045 [Aspergillus granulosus]|uniref:GPI anchored serine-threonine rich protein n=1 Tax=Aspergillus granulosus TaxID=176169 RepID=A0ABR4I5H0_9EURO